MVRNKLILILIIVIIAMAGSISGLIWRLGFVSDERDRWQNNFINDSVRYTDETGAEAIRVQELQFTIADLKETKDSIIYGLLQDAKDLGNKNKHLEQLISVKTRTVIKEVIIPIVDTVIIREGLPDVERVATIESEWLSASLAIHSDAVEVLNYESRDEIVVVMKWYKERKFFVRRWFERKKYAADIKSKNPNSKIRSAENVRITGKRGR